MECVPTGRDITFDNPDGKFGPPEEPPSEPLELQTDEKVGAYVPVTSEPPPEPQFPNRPTQPRLIP